jgi:hypothetical protein
MQVTLGLSLDDRQGPSGRHFFAEPVVGPAGLLALLETYLGIARPVVARAQRVAEYLGDLRACDNERRFYSRALQVDDIGTAAKLLSWRDEWRLGGWAGTFTGDVSLRLRDLADVEASASGRITPGEAERLLAVSQRLCERAVPIRSIRLQDPLPRFPLAWRRVLHCFNCELAATAAPCHSGRLGDVQRAALASLNEGASIAPLLGPGDDSLQVIQAQCRETAEHWLSARCRHQGIERLLVCEANGSSLDDTLRVSGVATCGFDQPSSSRPALQAIALSLQTLWKPLDFDRLLEFLTHRFGPFSLPARRTLAWALGEKPGIGSDAWEHAKESIASHDGGKELLPEIAFWLEGERWARADGAPISAVLQRVERLKQRLRAHLGADDATQAQAAAASMIQIKGVQSSLAELQRQGQLRVSPRQIEQIIAQSTSAGVGNSLATAEVGCWRSVTAAASASLEGSPEVIWWMPSNPLLPRALPWSSAELQTLHESDVEVRDLTAEMRALAAHWLRPLLAATERFVLVLPLPGEEEHPLWQLIRQIAPATPITSIEAELQAGRESAIAQPVKYLPLPGLAARWELGSPIVSRLQRQSYTSLSELFGNPAVAVLKDAAQLRYGISTTVHADNRLLGTLAHRLVELLFSQDQALLLTSADIRAWHGPALDSLIDTEGAPLLELGAKMLLEHFHRISLRGILNLHDQLRAAGALAVATEVAMTGTVGGTALAGKIDMVVELPRGRFAALDLKWSGAAYHARLLRDGGYLQLALYASLLHENRHSWPATLGYFAFDQQQLYVLDAGVFPKANVCSPKNGVTADSLLQMAGASLQWRTKQLQGGSVDVVDTRRASIDQFQGAAGTLPVAPLGLWYDRYTPLLGWVAQ